MQITFAQIALPIAILVLFLWLAFRGKQENTHQSAPKKTSADEEKFREAVLTGNLKAVWTQLDAKVRVDSQYPKNGLLPVHVAVIGGHAQILKSLITAGAQASVPDPKGVFPIHYAAMKGDLECLEILLKAGANPDELQLGSEKKPIHYAADKGHLNFIKRLLAAGAQGNMETVEMMIPPHLRETPVSDVTHPDVPLPIRIEKLAECGIMVLPEMRESALKHLGSRLDIDPEYVEILSELGREDHDGNWLSNDVWFFDLEEAELDETYKKVAERFRDMGKGMFPLQNIQSKNSDDENVPAWVSFTLHAKNYKWNIIPGWLDLDCLKRFTDLFDSLNTGRRFARITFDFGQCLAYVCVTPDQYEKLEELLGEDSVIWCSDDE